MPDAARRGCFGGAKHQIIVLTPLKPDTQASHLFDERAAICPEMIDDVVTEHQVGVPIGLKIRLRTTPCIVDAVRVGVKTSASGWHGSTAISYSAVSEREVIVIQQRDELADSGSSAVLVCGDMSVGLSPHKFNARIQC
jgi:hypothetical protein